MKCFTGGMRRRKRKSKRGGERRARVEGELVEVIFVVEHVSIKGECEKIQIQMVSASPTLGEGGWS